MSNYLFHLIISFNNHLVSKIRTIITHVLHKFQVPSIDHFDLVGE